MRDLLESLDQIDIREEEGIEEPPYSGRSLTYMADLIKAGFERQLGIDLDVTDLERNEHGFLVGFQGVLDGAEVELVVKVSWKNDGTPRKPVVLGYAYVEGDEMQVFHYRTDLPDDALGSLLNNEAAHDITVMAQDAMEESAEDLSAITRLSRS